MMIDETLLSIQEIPGFVKAVALQTDKVFIEMQEKENGIVLVEKELEQMGFPLQYDSFLSPSTLVPLSKRIASLIAIRNVFCLNDEQIRQMGSLAIRSSFLTKLTLRYLISLSKMAKELPRHWQRHYTVGRMDAGELHEDQCYFIICLRDFKAHPIFCTYLSGYIIGGVEMIGNYPNLTIQEIKCQHRGDEYHEFKISWSSNNSGILNENG
jgi:predicted hydrocarbon binding protein